MAAGNIGKGLLWGFVLIGFAVVYFKLVFAIDKCGRAKEAKKKEQRRVLRQGASKEELLEIVKQEKQEGIFTVIGIIMTVIVMIPVGFCVCIWCMMYVL